MVAQLGLILLNDTFHCCVLVVFLNNLFAEVSSTLSMMPGRIAFRPNDNLAETLTFNLDIALIRFDDPL